jgi:hypothetical protein
MAGSSMVLAGVMTASSLSACGAYEPPGTARRLSSSTTRRSKPPSLAVGTYTYAHGEVA